MKHNPLFAWELSLFLNLENWNLKEKFTCLSCEEKKEKRSCVHAQDFKRVLQTNTSASQN